MNKVIRDGKVAVLYSPGYGAGWSTWNTSIPALVFDPDVVAWVEAGKVGPLPDLQAKYGTDYIYDGGAADLEIRWIPVGTKFYIDEYDGYESIRSEHHIQWCVA